MQKETTFGRTKEEALSKMDEVMLYKHPDAIYSRQCIKITDYGDENSVDNYVAECIF